MSAAYGNEARTARAFQAAERGDKTRRFRAAVRHSRRVRLLRIALPATVVVAGVLIALASWFNPLRILARLPIGVGNVVVSGTKIKMENPKLSGFTRDSRRYDLSAGAAAQDLTKPGMIELQDIDASLEIENNGLMKLKAAAGIFDTNKEVLTLHRDILVTSTNGQQGYLEEAVVNVRSGHIVSEKPVKLKTLNGTVQSNRFELFQSGDLVRFENGVVVNMRMNEPAPSEKPATR